MPGLLEHLKNTESWEIGVPADLVPAVTHLRKAFEDAHWGCGHTTERFCYAALHNTKVDDPQNEYFNYLRRMKVCAGGQQFDQFLKQGTPPATFKAFWDLYLDCLVAEAVRILQHLIEIGLANEQRLPMPCVEWAEAQVKHMVRSHIHLIPMWVRGVCDKQPYDPKDDAQERTYWRKWRAPEFLVMVPSKYRPYDASAVWERNSAETSRSWLESFSTDYVIHIEHRVGMVAGVAAVNLAKKPKAASEETRKDSSRVESGPAISDPTRNEASPAANSDAAVPEPRGNGSGPSARLKARMRKTRARHKRWQKLYQQMKKTSPNHPLSWYAQRISGHPIAEGHSAETIRKHLRG